MNGHGYPYPARQYPGAPSGPAMMDLAGDAINGFDMVEGQSLDSIVAQNDNENRRRSMPVYARAAQINMGSPDTRRLSMMNFGDPNGGDMDEFQFNMSGATMDGMMRASAAYPRTTADMQNDRLPVADLAINTQFQGQNSPYSNMAAPGSAYASPMHQKSTLDMDMGSYPSAMSMAPDMDDSFNMMSTDMNMFPGSQFNTSMLGSPVNQDFVGPSNAPSQDNSGSSMQRPEPFKNPSMGNVSEPRSGASSFPSRTGSQDQSSMRSNSRPLSEKRSSTSVPTRMSLASPNAQQPVGQDGALDLSKDTTKKQYENSKFPSSVPPGGFPSTMHSNPHMKTQFKNAYSSTGFDMIGVLVRLPHAL